MPDSKAKLDQSLAEFLEATSKDKREGWTIAGLYTQFDAFKAEVRLAHQRTERRFVDQEIKFDKRLEEQDNKLGEVRELADEAHARLDAHRTAIVAGKRVMRTQHHTPESTALPEFREAFDTGSFDLREIQKEIESINERKLASDRAKAEEAKEKRENATWFKRHLITISFAAAGTVLAALLVILFQLAVVGARQQMVPNGPQINVQK
jgi:uncharacterized coiled-coil DUF342 family protein